MATEGAALTITGLVAGYGRADVLRGVDLAVPAGEVTCVMGRNGAGKSTLLKAIIGLVARRAGAVRLDGRALHVLPAHRIARAGIAWVPQGRRLFGPLSVAENLAVGGLMRGNSPAALDRVLAMFPRLATRLAQRADTLSGGEQQMLAIARALLLEPRVLLLDEPGEGLQPSMVALIQAAIARLRSDGVAVLLVEQRIEPALRAADRIAFMVAGRIVEERPAASLSRRDPAFLHHVGV